MAINNAAIVSVVMGRRYGIPLRPALFNGVIAGQIGQNNMTLSVIMSDLLNKKWLANNRRTLSLRRNVSEDTATENGSSGSPGSDPGKKPQSASANADDNSTAASSGQATKKSK